MTFICLVLMTCSFTDKLFLHIVTRQFPIYTSLGLRCLLHQGLSEPEFEGGLVYKFKRIMGRIDFSDQFRKIIIRYKRIGYDLNAMRQISCFVNNTITVDNFAAL